MRANKTSRRGIVFFPLFGLHTRMAIEFDRDDQIHFVHHPMVVIKSVGNWVNFSQHLMGVNEFSSHLVKTVFRSLLLYFFFVMWFFLPLVYLFSCFFCFFFFFFVCPCVLFFLVSSPSILKFLLWLLTLSFCLPSYVLTFLFLFFFCSHPLFSPFLFLGLSFFTPSAKSCNIFPLFLLF